MFYDAGTLIAIGAKPLGPFVVADCWLAAENLMLAACALGLGTCCIGAAVGALNSPDTKSELAIPSDVEIVAPIVVGMPNETAAEISADRLRASCRGRAASILRPDSSRAGAPQGTLHSHVGGVVVNADEEVTPPSCPPALVRSSP